MKASEMTLQSLLAGPNQYVIPVFQRYYSWGRENWEGLWEDLEEMLEPDRIEYTHFLGAMVFVADLPMPGRVPTFQVIDGQQRLVTLSLFLCALRDVAEAQGFKDLVAEINSTVLVHPFKRDREHFRVYPRQRDRDQFISAVKQKQIEDGNIKRCLAFFIDKIGSLPQATTEDGLREFFGFLQSRLEMVAITLQGENPYRIFRSLNSTGVDLSEGDLIRNFVFMHVRGDEQDQFDDERWRPLEEHFYTAEGRLNSGLLSAFFRDFMMSEGKYIPLATTFQEFESHYTKQGVIPDKLTDELDRYAQFYDVIRGVQSHPDAACQKALRKLRSLESSTTYPLLLNLMLKVEHRHMSSGELATAVELLASFILRRFVCSDTSRPYGRWFVTACQNLKPDPVDRLRAFLTSKGFPDDERFQRNFQTADLYSSRYNRPVLEALERAQGHKEAADLSEASIEHIMPQTLTDGWRSDLGDEYSRVHREWLHTIGNLTLSAYNPELYNKPFAEKKQRYADSNIVITRQLAVRDKWTDVEIIARGAALADMARTIWIGPTSI